MANEATIRNSLQIKKTSGAITILDYQSRPTQFSADVTGTKGPVPGAVAISTSGTDIDFSELTQPGLCTIMNLDATNFVEFGIWDPETLRFYPLGELLAGETYTIRISRNLGQEQSGVDVGTAGPTTNRLRFKANTATVQVAVEAFEV